MPESIPVVSTSIFQCLVPQCQRCIETGKKVQQNQRQKQGSSRTEPGARSPAQTCPKSTTGFRFDPEVVARLNRQHNRYWIDDALIGPNDPPVNILGGYKFPNAPAVDLNPIAPKTEKQKFSPDQQKRLDELRAQILADLSIPAFLWRSS